MSATQPTSSSTSPEQDAQRLQDLHLWLSNIASPKLDLSSIRPASADASFRRYFRIDGEAEGTKYSFIVMDAPQPQEDVKPFIQVANLFKQITRWNGSSNEDQRDAAMIALFGGRYARR